MADNVQPNTGEQREESPSGLLLSVDPLQATNNYKLAGDDSDSDKGGLLGDDASDSDGSDSDLLGGDDDGSDASDSDGTDAGDSDGSDGSDADGSDAGSVAGADSDSTDAQMNPLGIGETNVDGTSTDNDGTDGTSAPGNPQDI